MGSGTRLTELLIISASWDACSSSPCINGATCVDVNVDTFICVCRGGFFGVTCENSEYCYTFFGVTCENSEYYILIYLFIKILKTK